jgi:FlaA1/EpsC-like NDP-sugar epimerase
MFCYTFFLPVGIPKSIFAISFFIDIVLIGGGRLAYRLIRRIAKRNLPKIKETKRVMIVGGGYAGAIVVKELIVHPELKRVPVVIIDDDRSKIGRKINGISIAGSRKDIVELADSKQIDEIIITIPIAEKNDIQEIFNECSKTRCKTKILAGVSEMIDGPLAVRKIRDIAVEDLLGREPVNIDIGTIASYMEGQVVLVTGGGGSIGSELCRQISAIKPKMLIILDNNENGAYELQNELLWCYPHLNLITVIANIREVIRLNEIFERYKPDVVFHAAAHKHVPLMEMNPTEAIKNNILGSLNVVECAYKFGVKRFILISTDKAVNPTNIMGATKRVAEMIIQSFNGYGNTIFAAVRFGNVLGSNGSVIPLFKKQIELGGPVTVTHPGITRFFMTISEAAQLVIEAGAVAKGGEIFVLDMGKPVKIYDLAKTLIKLSGFEPEVDIDIKFIGLRPGEKMHEELFYEHENLQPTGNDKINIVPPVFIDKTRLLLHIDELNNIVLTNPDEATSCLYDIISND